MKSSYRLIVPLVVAAALVAGCGGGGSSTESTATTATTTALAKAELLEQGDAICAEVNAAVGTVGSSSATSSAATQAASLYSGMVASLKNLGTPRETAGYAEFIATAEALATAEDEVKLASEREDTAGLETAESKASEDLSAFQAAAGEYGFKQCSEGPKPPSAGTEGAESGGAEAPSESAPEAAPEEAAEAAPEAAPETGGAGGTEGGGGSTGGGGGGSSGGIGPG